mgnify:CR=1 FL=1|jgi:hypothetical protein
MFTNTCNDGVERTVGRPEETTQCRVSWINATGETIDMYDPTGTDKIRSFPPTQWQVKTVAAPASQIVELDGFTCVEQRTVVAITHPDPKATFDLPSFFIVRDRSLLHKKAESYHEYPNFVIPDDSDDSVVRDARTDNIIGYRRFVIGSSCSMPARSCAVSRN